jgi:hypothetical protein
MGLGWALRSEGIDQQARAALINIKKHRGAVNFWAYGMARISPDELGNVLIGVDWTGDDKTLIANLRKLRGLKSVCLAGDAETSLKTGDIQNAIPGVAVKLFERTPSPYSASCYVTMHNRTDRHVDVLWVGYKGTLEHPRNLKPDERRKQRTHVGGRYEAYINGTFISRYVVIPDQIWTIKADDRKGDR